MNKNNDLKLVSLMGSEDYDYQDPTRLTFLFGIPKERREAGIGFSIGQDSISSVARKLRELAEYIENIPKQDKYGTIRGKE